MKQITEEMGIHKNWYEEARDMTIEKLPEFIKELTEEYKHDYGTICHAIASIALAAAHSVDKTPQGGITGFQAGAVMWQFIKEWNYRYNKTSLRIIDYDDFLYPQSAYKFEKTIDSNIWESIQKAAIENIKKADKEYTEYLTALEKYKDEIKLFVEKYPDYYERREYYDPLGIGTCEQWRAEEKKKAGGFEFAPQPPYEPIKSESEVYKHWKNIADGFVPFGYSVR